MVSTFEIELCYRFILGRKPESVAVVETLAQHCQTFEDVRHVLLNSDEFKAALTSTGIETTKSLLWPSNRVDADVSPEYLTKMLSRVEQSWREMGASEPFWSVLTADAFLSTNLEANKAEFFRSGQEGVEFFIAAATRAGVTDLGAFPTCLEYGCGVGRLTIWLAQRFREVIACDISRPHITMAETAFAERNINNVKTVVVSELEQIRSLPRFDVFFSLIVLQHNPPPVVCYILEKVLEKLNPGGLAYFQVPTSSLNYAFDAGAYVESKEAPGMEMHVVPQHKLFALFKRCGCKVLEVREDAWCGPTFVSNSFLLRK